MSNFNKNYRTNYENKPKSSSEPLKISSSNVSVIDQFMLSNKQFWDLLENNNNDLEASIKTYGGCSFNLISGDYKVIRNPYTKTIVVVSSDGNSRFYEKSEQECLEEVYNKKDEMTKVGEVYVDTRCFVVFDSSLLLKSELISEYMEFTAKEDDKGARDFLRQEGASVRYGFNRNGDELDVYSLNEEVILLTSS